MTRFFFGDAKRLTIPAEAWAEVTTGVAVAVAGAVAEVEVEDLVATWITTIVDLVP